MTVQIEEPDISVKAFRESFEAFYRREIKSVVGLAYVLSGSSRSAEDLAQDSFVAAYRNWDRVSGYDNPGAWVRRVVANHAASRFRRTAAEARALLRMRSDPQIVRGADPDALHLWEEVRRLPPRQAQVIALRYYDQRSIAEIAVILQCSETTVKTHIQRAKAKLARSLSEEKN